MKALTLKLPLSLSLSLSRRTWIACGAAALLVLGAGGLLLYFLIRAT